MSLLCNQAILSAHRGLILAIDHERCCSRAIWGSANLGYGLGAVALKNDVSNNSIKLYGRRMVALGIIFNAVDFRDLILKSVLFFCKDKADKLYYFSITA